MQTSGKYSVTLTAEQRRQVWDIVDEGEFDTPGAVLREALRAWLAARSDDPVGRIPPMNRSFKRRRTDIPDPYERVDLMFDARDAKA